MAKNPLVIALTICFFSVLSFDDVLAACKPHPIAGVWKAKKYSKYSPKKLEIIHNCEARTRSGKTKPEWVIRVFHLCRPKDCIWGRAAAVRDNTGIFQAKFETFSATRTITIVPRGYRIEVKYTIDYRLERRQDLQGWVFMAR